MSSVFRVQSSIYLYVKNILVSYKIYVTNVALTLFNGRRLEIIAFSATDKLLTLSENSFD